MKETLKTTDRTAIMSTCRCFSEKVIIGAKAGVQSFKTFGINNFWIPRSSRRRTDYQRVYKEVGEA